MTGAVTRTRPSKEQGWKSEKRKKGGDGEKGGRLMTVWGVAECNNKDGRQAASQLLLSCIVLTLLPPPLALDGQVWNNTGEMSSALPCYSLHTDSGQYGQ